MGEQLPTRIWRFGALAPVSSAERVSEILWLSGRYYNRLVEIERHRCARFAAIRRAHAPELVALMDDYERADARVGELLREAKRHRQRHWQRSGGEKTREVPLDIEAELVVARKVKKAASEAAKPLRKAFNERLKPHQERLKEVSRATAKIMGGSDAPGPRIREKANAEALKHLLEQADVDPIWAAIASSDRDAQEDVKRARASCLLPPGCYLVVEEAVERACKDRAPSLPRFCSFRGEGRIAVQLHRTTVADLLHGRSAMFQLRDVRDKGYCTARIRIGSGEDRSPVWADFPVRLHRQPPGEAAVKWVWITVRRVGERMRYELQLVLQHASFAEPKRPLGVGDGGHIRLGWGRVPHGVCVATWPSGELVVPELILGRAEKAEELRSYADRHFEQVKRVLRLWLRLCGQRTHWDRVLGDRKRLELRQICVAFAEYRFGDAPRILWREWVDSRPTDLFPSLRDADRWIRVRWPWAVAISPQDSLAWWLYLWARKDRHLRQWAADSHRRHQNSRDALFRATAIRLSTQFSTLSIDNYSIAKLKELPDLSLPGELVYPDARHNLHLAAPGRFREILLEVMGERCTPRERLSDAAGAGSARGRKSAKRTSVSGLSALRTAEKAIK